VLVNLYRKTVIHHAKDCNSKLERIVVGGSSAYRSDGDVTVIRMRLRYSPRLSE
jgi:hypothetical protein